MKNKYYTPEIEEFRIGFEFEKYDNRPATYKENDFKPTNWHKHTYNLTSIRLSQLGTHLYNKTLRVKYLDKEYIESEDFNYIPIEGEKGTLLFESNRKDLRGEEVGLVYNPKSNWIVVYTGEWSIRITDEQNQYSFNPVLFAGEIKNISEFKTLLKQLNLSPSSI